MIGGRVAEEIFTAERVILMVPLGTRPRWCHPDCMLLCAFWSAGSVVVCDEGFEKKTNTYRAPVLGAHHLSSSVGVE